MNRGLLLIRPTEMTTAKIIIESETNCRIMNLELATRKKLAAKFSYDIPGAKYSPAFKLGRWNGKKSFCSLSCQTYLNLLPEIIPILENDGYEFEIEDLRPLQQTFEFTEVNEDSYAHVTWPKGHSREGQPIMLRDYQANAINIFMRNTQSIQCLSTSSGKSIICAVLSHRCEAYGRTIVVVPSKDLVRQTAADYINMGLDTGLFFGDTKDFNKTHTICTWQSLHALFKNTKNGEAAIPFGNFIDGVVCIIIDECHRISATALLELLTGPMANVPIRLAVTGTIPKEDFEKRSLQVAIGDVLGTIKACDLQAKGVLSDCHIHIKQLVDHGEYKEYQDELRYLLENDARIKYMASMIENIAKTGNTLVLIDRIEPGKALAELIPGAKFLSGATKSKVRKAEYDSVATSDDKLLIASYGIASTGISIDFLYNIVLIEPGKSFVRVIQSIGRGLRRCEGKDFVDIYDITSTCKFAKRHLTKRKAFYKEAEYEFTIEKVDWGK